MFQTGLTLAKRLQNLGVSRKNARYKQRQRGQKKAKRNVMEELKIIEGLEQQGQGKKENE